MICLLAVSGCNGTAANQTNTEGSAPASTSAPSSSAGTENTTGSGKKSEVVYTAEENDTTQMSLDYLRERVPLYTKYMEKHAKMPMTLVSEINDANGKTTTGIYVKDETHMVVNSIKPDGSETRIVYIQDKTYQVEPENKVIYVFNSGEDSVKESVRKTLANINISDAAQATYNCDTGTYENVTYNRESIKFEDFSSEFYFDTETDDLVYVVQKNSVTKIVRFENNFTNDELLVLPEEYETKTFGELQQRYKDEREAAESRALESLTQEFSPEEAQ